MPIVQLVQDAGLQPEETHILTEAFDQAWERFKASGNPLAGEACAPSTRALLAKRMVETASKGEKNADRLIEDALTYLAETVK
jgi:N-acetylglucosamine kinase-like BadF-type ATPase